MMADEELQNTFERACEFLRGVAGKLSSEDLLYFYARFKQAKEGPNTVPKPGFFDFQGKQKWQAWKDVGDMALEQAMREYVDRLDDIDADWRGKEPSSNLGWVSVSVMARQPGDNIAVEEKTAFDWAKEGNRERLLLELERDLSLLSSTDETGMSLLHWAADRGDDNIVCALLDRGASVNQSDSDGQTALHFASSCGHGSVVRILLLRGADKTVVDNEGQTPLDSACDEEIKLLLQSD